MTDRISNYMYRTPQKVTDITVGDKNRDSDVKTVSTVSTDSPFLTPSSRSPSPPPSFQHRANLMTLVVDMKDISPDLSPEVASKKAMTKRVPLSVKNTNTPTARQNYDETTVPVDKLLQLMVKSTNRILTEAQKDLNKELHREYPTPTSTYSDDEEEQLCYEMSKLTHLERSCQHEMDFAIDKIAYRHSSTTEWATNCDLIHMQKKLDKATATKMCNDNEGIDQDFFDRFCEIFCCNHGVDMNDAVNDDSTI